MKLILLIIAVLTVSSCRVVSNADEMLSLLKKCEEMFNEECSMIAAPHSFEDEIRAMYVRRLALLTEKTLNE